METVPAVVLYIGYISAVFIPQDKFCDRPKY